MPRLQDIERFKRDLAALSREEEVLARWGESPEDIPPPPSASDEIPAASEDRARPAAAEASIDQPEEGLPPDFAALLDELPLEKTEEAGEKEGEASSRGSMDAELDALLGISEPSAERASEVSPEAAGLEAMPEFEIPEQEPEAVPEVPVVPETSEASEAMPEFELPALEGDLEAPERPSGFEIPESTAETESPETVQELETPEPSGGVEGSLADMGFEVPEIAETFGAPEGVTLPETETETQAAEALEVPEAGEESAAPPEEFSIPDFGFGEEPAASSIEAEASSGLPEPGTGETQAGEAEESFSIPLEETSPAEGGEAPAEEPRAAEPSSDAFEAFSFEEPGGGEIGVGGEIGAGLGADFGTGLGTQLDEELASLGETPQADTFNIDREWGGFPEPSAGAPPPKATPPRPSAHPAEEEKYKPVSLSESQVDRLQDSLLSYPLNLRVAVEDILANEKGSMAQRSKLVWALVDGAAPDEIAPLASRVLKKRIEIPKGFEKKTGAAREAEKGSLGYIFLHTVLPVLRVALLAVAMASALGWLGYRFVYRALAANASYRSGYQRIAEGRYPEAETSFAKALVLHEDVKWYYRYAEAYVSKRQYLLAEGKYAALIERHPKERAGILAWARLEKDQLKFEEAVKVLKGTPRRQGDESTRGMSGLLSWDYFNEDGLLLLGDIYLEWAEEDPKWYEEARRNYAGLIQRYGQKDAYMERMLLYFIRTDNFKEVKPLADRYLAGLGVAESAKIPIGALALAELGGYFLDKGLLENVRTALNAAALKDPSLPEAHYHLARYFRRSDAPEEERKALDKAIKSFANLPGLGGKREAMYIDSLIWRGNFRLDGDEWLAAEQDFGAAATEYERGLDLRRLTRSARFSQAYAGLAEVAYWQRDDLQSALNLFERAAADGYDTPDTRYKRGYILYRGGRIAESLPLFYRAGLDGNGSPYLDYAFGAALYARGDYYAAEGSFRRVVEAMTRELEQINMPSPQARPSQGEIVELLMKAENNLGASIYRAATRVGDARRRGVAMAAFSESTRLFDSLTRDLTTLVRSESKNLGFLNMDFILHPQRDMDIVIYGEIEREMRFPKRQR
jgi:tetratricopeptide (TPR) repeat protein